MKSYSDKLINLADAFTRESFEKRMAEFGFKNMERMEKFLWDLELFLQIQSILGDRIVLKGGAATQFYLSVHEQRTSLENMYLRIQELLCHCIHIMLMFRLF